MVTTDGRFNDGMSSLVCRSSKTDGRPAVGRGTVYDVSRARSPLPATADPLSETLHLLRLDGTLYCRAELTAPWGVRVPRLEGFMTFQVVTHGQGWLEVEGLPPRRLTPGSLTLLPHGVEHCMRSAQGVDAQPLFDIPVEQISERYEIMRYGGGGELTRATYGVMRFDHVAARRLFELLPTVLHIDSWDDAAGGWLQSTLRFITHEASMLRPGGETVITRLADILVVQAIRSWLDSAPEARVGWLAALRDEQVGRALACMHREPQRDWTVPALAKEVGMSRSGFSARFTRLVGESAMRYLARWRLQLARTRIADTTEAIATIAAEFGYRSEASFGRAFKRMFGVSPGSLRRDDAPSSS